MRKNWTTLMVMLLLAVLAATGAAQTTGTVKVSAISDIATYHQLIALIVEYDQEVADPGADAYTVIDFAAANLKADYDRRDYAEGVITAVYTNNTADICEDKTSVPGKYVVIELEPCNGSYYNEEIGMQVANNVACLCTWRLPGDQCEWFRDDFSQLVVSQKSAIKNADGDVVAKAGLLPTLEAENIRHLKLEQFEQLTLKNAQGYDIHYSLALPENYDPAKEYPMVVSVSGNGGRLNYNQQDADGNFICIGGNIGRDAAAAAWLECEEDVIVVSPQPWRNQPEEWGIDYVADTIQLNWSHAKDTLKCITDVKMPVYIWHGVNDGGAPWTNGLTLYEVLRAVYQEEGLSEAEIDELVYLYFADDPEHFAKGICEIHATSKLAVSYPWFLEMVLAR